MIVAEHSLKSPAISDVSMQSRFLRTIGGDFREVVLPILATAALPMCNVAALSIIAAIVKGEITTDGDFGGAATDFLIDLGVLLDDFEELSLAAASRLTC